MTHMKVNKTPKLNLSEKEWKEKLTSEQFRVLRNKATDTPFTGKYYKEERTGIYRCAACGHKLFLSDTKYDSGCGWPSFYRPIDENNIIYEEDNSFIMRRTEILCSNCGSHLGHVFDDGPQPTGLRYCVNSTSLDFEATDNNE